MFVLLIRNKGVLDSQTQTPTLSHAPLFFFFFNVLFIPLFSQLLIVLWGSLGESDHSVLCLCLLVFLVAPCAAGPGCLKEGPQVTRRCKGEKRVSREDLVC